MIDGAGDLANEGFDVFLRHYLRARSHLRKNQRPVRLGCNDLAADMECGDRAAHIVAVGVAEIVGKDAWLGAPGTIGELDLAAALGTADAEVEAEPRPAVEPQRQMFGREVR